MKNSLDPKLIIGAIVGVLAVIGIIVMVSASRKAPPVTETQKQDVRLKVEQQIESEGKK